MIRVNRWTTATLAIAFFLVGGARFLQGEPTGVRTSAVQPSESAEKSSPEPTDSPAQGMELAKSAAKLREIMSAIHTYHSVAGHYPPASFGWGYDRKTNEWFRTRPYVSWRVLLLPLLGEKELFDKFKLGEPWDSDHNRQLIPLMPEVYRAPGSKAGPGMTNYLGAVGPNAAFPDKGTIMVPDIPDGTSKTIMLVEVPDRAAVEWTRPEDFPVDTKNAVKKLAGLRDGGVLTAFADGAPQFISSDIPPETLALLFVRNDYRPIDDFQRWVRFVKPAEKTKVLPR